MKPFDPKYVRCTWDESLKGKKVFYSDFIQCIKEEVNGYRIDARGICAAYNPDDIGSPFIIHSPKDNVHSWAFVYYDPYYEVKKAYEEGKQLQLKYHTGDWVDLNIVPGWTNPPEDYRIKPEEEPKRMTYRQLAEWLAKGNGQQSSIECSVRYTFHEVLKEEESKEVPAVYRIRRWGSDEWVEPTVNVYEADCVTKECE